MRRKKIIVRGPALSQSGYGEQTRFALRSLRKHQDKFDIYLLNVGWGRTGCIISDDEERQWFDELIAKTQTYVHENQNKPNIFDISLQVTIPGEFEQLCPINVGYTAGIETTKAPPEWINRNNLMHKIIATSVHTKTVLQNSIYKLKDQNGMEVELKTHAPVEVCGYGARIVQPSSLELNLETDFNFLTIAQWGPRKNLESTISSFVGEFFNESNVGLIVKTNMAKNNFMDKMIVEARLKNFVEGLPNSKEMKCKIYLIHGNLQESEISALYTHPKVKAFITTTHGEGFGLPIFESVLNALPVVAPAWSGQVDFLYAPKKDKDSGKIKMKPHFVKIDYDIQPIQKDAVVPGILQEDSQWCYPKNYSIRAGMKEVFKNYGTHLSNAKKLKEYIMQEFDENKQYDLFVKLITDCLPVEIEEPKSKLEETLGSNIITDIIGL